MNINNVQELKAAFIDITLAEYAETTGKPFEQIKKLFEDLPFFHEMIMEIVEEAAEKMAANLA
ncbi:hypothetical protein ACT2CV_01275 [Pasteurellaceae bacterium 22721_9_1]